MDSAASPALSAMSWRCPGAVGESHVGFLFLFGTGFYPRRPPADIGRPAPTCDVGNGITGGNVSGIEPLDLGTGRFTMKGESMPQRDMSIKDEEPGT